MQLLIFIIILNFVNCSNNYDSKKNTPIIIKHPKNVKISNETSSILLECGVESKDAKFNVTWYKDGFKLKSDHKKYRIFSNNSLFISFVNIEHDHGVYNCKAQNYYGHVVSNNATVAVTYLKENFQSMESNRQVNVGSDTMLECKEAPHGNRSIIWWEKDGKKLIIDNRHLIVLEDYSLKILNVTIDDVGHYSCIMRNEVGLKRRTRNVNIDKPLLVLKPKSDNYFINSKIELICEAKGFPEPQIEWFKENNEDLVIKKGTVFVIENARVEDEGEYKCKATNSIGSVEAKAKVSIYEKPSFLKALPNYSTGFEFKSLTIECNAKGHPQPVIYWAKSTSTDLSKNNQNSQDDYIILENGNLFIERLTKKYEGTYLCQASNEYGSIEMKTVLQVKQMLTRPPPIILYGPQNQTIAINTQAILECKTTGSEIKPIVIWHKGNQQITNQQYETRKFNLDETGSLIINSVQKSDSDIYKCIVTTSFGQTVSSGAILKIEDPNDPNVEFRRNYDSLALPSACGQPTVLTITSKTIQLTWQTSVHVGRTKTISYRIEYFSPEWPRNSLGWVVLADDISAHTNFYTVNNLQSDTYYLFIVRARNEQGYGAPSPVSDLVKTLFEPQSHFREKNSNELLEKALTGEIVLMNEPFVVSSTCLNITWKVIKSNYLIEGFIIKYKQTGTKEYNVEKIVDNKQMSFLLDNLLKFTSYEIIIEPYSGAVHGSESNIVQVKTKEDAPDSSPLNLNVELESINSLSIKWESPPMNKTNGIILGYKINCVTNETKYNIHLNTNSSTRGIIIENLVEGMKYCVKVAAYTKIGTGPFSQPFKCVEMTEINLVVKERTYKEKFQEIMVEPWFISLTIILCLSTFIIFLCCLCCLFKRLNKNRKYTSSSTSSDTTLDANKAMHTTRYKLVNDKIWMDTLHSSNHSNPECCCVPDLNQQIFLQNKNNNTALHDLNVSLENRLLEKNSLRNTLIIKQNDCQTLNNNNKINKKKELLNTLKRQNTQNHISSPQPQYAEIYSPSHYASTGLFNDHNNNNAVTNTSSSNNLENSNTNTNSTFILANDKKYKTIFSQNGKVVIKGDNGLNREITEKELLRYIHSTTQSQTNTPRIPIKCIQSIQRVQSLENRFGNETQTKSHENNNVVHLIQNSTSSQPPPPPPPPPPPRVPPPNLSNLYIQENELHENKNSNFIPVTAVYNSPWNINLLSPSNNSSTINRSFNHDNNPLQNYMIIDENSQNILLNQIYQQQFNNEQTNRLYKIISLSNDIAQTMMKTNSLKLNDLSNLKIQNENEKTCNIQQSWENTVIPNNFIESSTNSSNSSNECNQMVNNSVTTTVSPSSDFSSNFENESSENEYATYLSTRSIDENDIVSKPARGNKTKNLSSFNRSKLNLS